MFFIVVLFLSMLLHTVQFSFDIIMNRGMYINYSAIHLKASHHTVTCRSIIPLYYIIVAKCPGLSGTVPFFWPYVPVVSRFTWLCRLSQNPARLHKWRCGTIIKSVYYRILARISQCLVGVAIHNPPKVGVGIQKWAWSTKFLRALCAH